MVKNRVQNDGWAFTDIVTCDEGWMWIEMLTNGKSAGRDPGTNWERSRFSIISLFFLKSGF